MKYLVIDGLLNGTGIRDKYHGGYISPSDLGLSSNLILEINQWLSKYEKEHFNDFSNKPAIELLDKEGINIALKIKFELSNVKIDYFSSGELTSTLV